MKTLALIQKELVVGSKDMRHLRANCGPLGLDLWSAPHVAKMNSYSVLFFTFQEIKSWNQYNLKEKEKLNLFFFFLV